MPTISEILLAWLKKEEAYGKVSILLSPKSYSFLQRMAGKLPDDAPLESQIPALLSNISNQESSNSEPKDPSLFLTQSVTEINVAHLGWEDLLRLATKCKACPLAQQRTHVVFGDGNLQAKLMFIGEGPGAEEDRQGLPFVGKAGMLLTKIIEAMGLTRKEVYIANVVKCRPPNNRVPTPQEAHTCLPYLRRQIELVQPEVIVLLGATPLRYLMGRDGLMQIRGQWLQYRGIAVMPTYHPAFLLRRPEYKRDVWEDIKKVMSKLNLKPI